MSAPVFAAQKCGGVDTAIISCEQDGTGTSASNSGAWGILLIVINIMTGGVGILAVGGIVYAAILYSAAQDNANQTKQAIELIWNIVIGIVVFGAMYALLNFIIPGGVFN